MSICCCFSDPDRQICHTTYLVQMLCVCGRLPLGKLSCDIFYSCDFVICVVDISSVGLTGIGCKSERALEVPKAALFSSFGVLSHHVGL